MRHKPRSTDAGLVPAWRFSATSKLPLRDVSEAAATLAPVDGNTQDRMRARDAAFRMLNRLTTGVAVGALAAVGMLSAVSASTMPGNAATAQTAGTTTTSSTSSGSGVVVSGGS